MAESKKDVFDINYQTTLNQLVNSFPEVVTILDDLNPTKTYTKEDFMGNMATIEEYANEETFSSQNVVDYLRKALAEKYHYPAKKK